jgi:hypothetical protein
LAAKMSAAPATSNQIAGLMSLISGADVADAGKPDAGSDVAASEQQVG